MKRATWLMALILLSLGLIPAGAGAQIVCEEPNLFVLFFDEEASIINLHNVGPGEVYNGYLYLLNPDPGCLRGFELEIIIPDQTSIFEITFPGDAVNFGTGGNFIVGFGDAHLSTDNRILLCTISLMNMSTTGEVQDFYMSPSTPASIEGHMAYLDCSMMIVATDPISLDYALPVARVNGSVDLDYCGELSLDGITVQISSQGDDDNLAGTSTWATDGYDPPFDLNDPEPDPVVFFAHPEWDSPNGGNFRHDIMGAFDPYAEMRTWSLTINSIFPQGYTPPYMVEVDFLPSFAGDENIYLTLVDHTTGEITLLEEPYLHIFPIYQSESRIFDLVIGYDTIYPLITALDVGLDVFCNGLADLGNHAATAEWATDGYDEDIDIPEPGPPPSNYLTASFTQEDWPFGPRFRTMVHGDFPTDLEIKTWPLRVETDQIGMVELNFTPDFDEAADIPLAPSGPNNLGYLGLLRPEWDLPLGDKIFRDLVAPDGEPVAWNAEIVVAEPGSVTLQWTRLNWPDDLDLRIYLPNANRVVLQSMRSQNSLRLPAPTGRLVVQFRTPHMSGISDIPASAYQLGIHPNPFNPQTTISFELIEEGEAEVRVYSVRGEMVSVLQSDATGLGRHEVIWTGRDRAGREVPSGSYFARLYVDGKAVGPVAKMSLIR